MLYSKLHERMEGRKEMFYLTTHSTHLFTVIWHQIWLRTILIVRKETCCRHIGYSFGLTARVILYAPSHRQDCTYHSLCYTSCGALAGTRNSSMGPPHEGLIQRPIAPWANALTTENYIWPLRANATKGRSLYVRTSPHHWLEKTLMWQHVYKSSIKRHPSPIAGSVCGPRE